LLQQAGFLGACHFTLDDGRFPSGNQSRVRWEGIGGGSVDSLVRLPFDANREGTFLVLAERLGDAMDLDHAATAVFAHWPGNRRPWYRDLIRASSYSPVLGRFFSIDEYFKDTKFVGQATRYTADAYRSPFLRQAVSTGEASPICRWQEVVRQEAADHQAAALSTMAALVAGPTSGGLAAIRSALAPADQPPGPGCFVANPLPFARKVYLDVSDWPQLPAPGGHVVAAAEQGGRKHLAVNVPGMGFLWVDPDTTPPPADEKSAKPKKRGFFARQKPPREEPPMAEENVLRNEFFEVKLDPATGAIRSLHDYRTRDNRLAQQLAFRQLPTSAPGHDGWDDDPEMLYSVMAADSIEVVAAGPMPGQLVAKGRLVDRNGQLLAHFAQTLKARRGSRVLEIEVQIDPETMPSGDPWTTYYAARFAWHDATAGLSAGIGTGSLATDSAQLEAPYYVDIRGEKTRTTILTGGLPYHRRFGLRKLDTLLLVAGETGRTFRYGIGVDVPYPYPAAMEFLAPESVATDVGPAPGAASGWLFHLNAKNVVATAWEPLVEAGRLKGVRVRLAETENRPVEATLQCCRPLAAARKVDFRCTSGEELTVEGDRVEVSMAGHQWIQIELEFAE